MARKYVCDRCKAEFETWATTDFDIPATSSWGSNRIQGELCQPCLTALRNLVKNLLANESN